MFINATMQLTYDQGIIVQGILLLHCSINYWYRNWNDEHASQRLCLLDTTSGRLSPWFYVDKSHKIHHCLHDEGCEDVKLLDEVDDKGHSMFTLITEGSVLNSWGSTNERTHLAWLRTEPSVAGAGPALPKWDNGVTRYLVAFVGIATLLNSTHQYFRFMQLLEEGKFEVWP